MIAGCLATFTDMKFEIIIVNWFLFILLKALLRVCMENTAQGVCREINAARGEAECCIYLETRPRVLYFSYT